MSTCLFVLCAEVLAIKIRNNKNIKGITINNTEYKLSQYADDTSVILDGSSTSLNETLNVLSSYAKYSGLKINFDKTSVVWIGKKKYSTDTIKTRWKLSWGKNNFKLLGIHFNVELHTMLELNYKEKLSKMKNLIQICKPNQQYHKTTEDHATGFLMGRTSKNKTKCACKRLLRRGIKNDKY